MPRNSATSDLQKQINATHETIKQQAQQFTALQNAQAQAAQQAAENSARLITLLSNNLAAPRVANPQQPLINQAPQEYVNRMIPAPAEGNESDGEMPNN